MRRIKKYILILILIITTSLILIGCGDIKVSTDTSININGTSDTKIKVYYDDVIGKLVNNDLMSKIINKVEDGISDKVDFGEIIKSKEGNFNIEEVNVSTNKVKIDEISNLSSDYFSIIEDKENGIFLDKYKITLKLNESAIDIISDYINSNINNNLGLDFGSLVNKNIGVLIGDIPIDVSISMPIKIIDTNADEIINNKTINYSYTVNDLNESNSIIIGFKAPNLKNILIYLAIIILIILTPIFYYIKKRKNVKS
ncbi:hypothetical protein [Clostridium sp.]|uniref:hypothetical protein n=1 Tax=Clostridium sp. TaxID=1506 RepID=UPI0025C23B28|nr:hypothetical protein [Clostridium sp.]MCI9069638.1 hypothetical protein [Clostridium sp.]MCI9302965.1 hypothetical protein [Clostridium sp.]